MLPVETYYREIIPLISGSHASLPAEVNATTTDVVDVDHPRIANAAPILLLLSQTLPGLAFALAYGLLVAFCARIALTALPPPAEEEVGGGGDEEGEGGPHGDDHHYQHPSPTISERGRYRMALTGGTDDWGNHEGEGREIDNDDAVAAALLEGVVLGGDGLAVTLGSPGSATVPSTDERSNRSIGSVRRHLCSCRRPYCAYSRFACLDLALQWSSRARCIVLALAVYVGLFVLAAVVYPTPIRRQSSHLSAPRLGFAAATLLAGTYAMLCLALACIGPALLGGLRPGMKRRRRDDGGSLALRVVGTCALMGCVFLERAVRYGFMALEQLGEIHGIPYSGKSGDLLDDDDGGRGQASYQLNVLGYALSELVPVLFILAMMHRKRERRQGNVKGAATGNNRSPNMIHSTAIIDGEMGSGAMMETTPAGARRFQSYGGAATSFTPATAAGSTDRLKRGHSSGGGASSGGGGAAAMAQQRYHHIEVKPAGETSALLGGAKVGTGDFR